MLVCKAGRSLVFHTTDGERRVATVPDAMTTDSEWVVIGHGEADTLAAVVSGKQIRVWSSITNKVVASFEAKEPPSHVEFDLHVAVAAFEGRIWITDLAATTDTVWHAMCSATNAHSFVPCWPHVVVLHRDGASIAVTNLSAKLSTETAPAVIVQVHADSTTRTNQTTRTRSLGLHQTASIEPALVSHPRTPSCVGRLTVVDGVAQWIAMSHNSRRLRLHHAPINTLTNEVAALHAVDLPWSLAHKDKYPSPDEGMCHVHTVAGGNEHIHVAYTAEDKLTGKRHQMITSAIGKHWHKTYVVEGSKPVVALVATDNVDTIAVLFAGGGHATLKTVPNVH